MNDNYEQGLAQLLAERDEVLKKKEKINLKVGQMLAMVGFVVMVATFGMGTPLLIFGFVVAMLQFRKQQQLENELEALDCAIYNL